MHFLGQAALTTNFAMSSSLSVLTGLLLAPLAALHAAEPFWEKVAPTGASATFHFQPPDSFFGDPIPFYHDGVHHVFFLHGKIGGKRTPGRDQRRNSDQG